MPWDEKVYRLKERPTLSQCLQIYKDIISVGYKLSVRNMRINRYSLMAKNAEQNMLLTADDCPKDATYAFSRDFRKKKHRKSLVAVQAAYKMITDQGFLDDRDDFSVGSEDGLIFYHGHKLPLEEIGGIGIDEMTAKKDILRLKNFYNLEIRVFTEVGDPKARICASADEIEGIADQMSHILGYTMYRKKHFT